MDKLKELLNRYKRTSVLFLGGLLLIIYIALGFVYIQQLPQQKKHEEQISNLTAILSKPLPSANQLQAEYDAVNQALIPFSPQEAIAMLVSIAEKSGINIDPNAGKFRVPPASYSQVKLPQRAYQLISFKGVYVQGSYDSVQAFISDLDSGSTLATMMLRQVNVNQVSVTPGVEEAARREEFRTVASAVRQMMNDNGLSSLPNPIRFSNGVAVNFMGDDPNTTAIVEGFPDITTPPTAKGYTGTGSPRNGYVLYQHDRISTDTKQFQTVSYINTLFTRYYYTCEPNGTVRQFDGPNIATANELLGSEASILETAAVVNVDIYTRP